MFHMCVYRDAHICLGITQMKRDKNVDSLKSNIYIRAHQENDTTRILIDKRTT